MYVSVFHQTILKVNIDSEQGILQAHHRFTTRYYKETVASNHHIKYYTISTRHFLIGIFAVVTQIENLQSVFIGGEKSPHLCTLGMFFAAADISSEAP